MVQTGRRATMLARLLEAGGLTVDAVKPRSPRLENLDVSTAEELLDIYTSLGGVLERPELRPGPWDLSVGGVLIELDEELHFNRYRKETLLASWASSLPWTLSYVQACDATEEQCLRAATWGRRWSSPSSVRMFGPGASPGELGTVGGAPRWKQRALYDAIKDAVAREFPVARLSVHDEVAGVPLDAALKGRQPVDVEDLLRFLAARTT